MSWTRVPRSLNRLEQQIKAFNAEVRERELSEKKAKKKRKKDKIVFPIMMRLRAMSPAERLEFLKEEARIKPWEKASKRYKRLRRVRFSLKSKYCIVCGAKANCTHHVKPLINGGTNKDNNLVPLCNACHEEIHPFMKDIREREKSIKKMQNNNPAYTPPEIRQ